MPDSTDLSNNGSGWPEKVLELNHNQLLVSTQVVVTNQNLMIPNVSSCIRNVTSKDSLPESALINLSLILTTMSNPSRFLKERLSTFITYLVSTVRTLRLIKTSNVWTKSNSACSKNMVLPYSKK